MVGLESTLSLHIKRCHHTILSCRHPTRHAPRPAPTANPFDSGQKSATRTHPAGLYALGVAEQQVVACWELEHDAWWASEEHPRGCGEQGMAKRVGWAADLVSRLAGVTDHEEQHWARGSTCTTTPALHGGQIPRQKPRLPWDRSADRRRFGHRGTRYPPTANRCFRRMTPAHGSMPKDRTWPRVLPKSPERSARPSRNHWAEPHTCTPRRQARLHTA